MTQPLSTATTTTRFLHTGWEFFCGLWPEKPKRLGFSTLEWLPAEVPGHVHLDLVRHGIILDPFVALGELGCQWVDEATFSYRTRFDFTPSAERPLRVLRFDGLDTVCSVFLNGERVAQHDNMFVPLEVDVTDRLIAGSNELRVEFVSAAAVGRERRARYLDAEGLPRDSTVRFDERAFLRKAQYMFGWDWGPRLVSVGVWRPVSLIEHAGRIVDVWVQQRHLTDGSVELTAITQIEGEGRARHRIEGIDAPFVDGQTVRLSNPKLWWPAGLGAQHLYRVTTELLATRGGETLLDRKVQTLGLKTLRLLREPDAVGESFEFEVNGGKLWALGANWICDHSFPSAVTRARLAAQLGRARDMNMNMLRVWGGGIYESDDFYDLCDALGILVWQDFPHACSHIPDDAAAQHVVREEARINVQRLRHHACLALWCGNNENLTMFDGKWGGVEQHPPRYYGEVIYDRVLPEVVAQFDPGRPYIPSSPCGGPTANSGGFGDQHYWDVWHGRGDWLNYRDSTGRFASEFGFAAAPGLAAWRRMAPGSEPAELELRHPVARWHDKTAKGYETFVDLVELHYAPSADLATWTYASQLNQRDALRFGIEHYRRSEFCKGSLIWQINDCWPVQSWAVLDSEGQYKAAAYELRRLYGDFLLSLEKLDHAVRLWAVLDNAQTPLEPTVVLEVRSLSDGGVLARSEARLRIAPGERRPVLELETRQFDPHEVIVVARTAEQSTFTLLADPKTLRLGEPALSAARVPEGLLVATDLPVVDLFLWQEGGSFQFEDNFLTLPEAGQRLYRGQGVVGRLCARSLKGIHALEFQSAAP